MRERFEVFFSYNTVDHAAVTRVARAMGERGICVFLDRWYLAAGQPWPQALERTLAACNAVAVFIGAEGLGPWQQRERDLALDRQGREPGLSRHSRAADQRRSGPGIPQAQHLGRSDQ